MACLRASSGRPARRYASARSVCCVTTSAGRSASAALERRDRRRDVPRRQRGAAHLGVRGAVERVERQHALGAGPRPRRLVGLAAERHQLARRLDRRVRLLDDGVELLERRVDVAAFLRQAGEQRQGALVAHRLRHERRRPFEHLARLVLGAAGDERAAGRELHVVLAGVRVGDPDQGRDRLRVVALDLRQLGVDRRERGLRALEARRRGSRRTTSAGWRGRRRRRP